jgi:hypothetical protein
MDPIQRLIVVASLGGLLNLSTAHAQPADDQHQCFFARNMQSWSAVDKNSFLIRATGGNYYYFKFKGLCPNLKYARVLAFKSNSTRVCGDTGEYVRVERQRCFIDSMQELDKQEYQALKGH